MDVEEKLAESASRLTFLYLSETARASLHLPLNVKTVLNSSISLNYCRMLGVGCPAWEVSTGHAEEGVLRHHVFHLEG